MTSLLKRAIMRSFDFNSKQPFWHHFAAFQLSSKAADEHWTNHLFAAHGLFPALRIPTLRRRYQGNRYVKNFSCIGQFLCLAFAQLTYRESLRDIEACLRAQQAKLYHMGFRGRIARATLAGANERRMR